MALIELERPADGVAVLCFTGRLVKGAEAARLGLATELVPEGRALDLAVDIAATIAAAPREVLVRTKAKAVRHAAPAPGGTLDL